MATEKKIPSRIQQKHDVAANWAKATNFIPKKGEIIIYDAEYNASGEETQPVRFKIGDGSKTVNNLPFAVIDYGSDIETLEQEVADNSTAIGKIQGAFESNGTTVKKATSAGTADKIANGLTLGNGVVYDGSKALSISAGNKISINGGPGGVSIDLAYSVMPSTYNKVTVDGFGTVTAGENVDYAKKTDLPDVSGKLDKTPYEVNKTIDFGNSGALCIGKFKVYDTNVTCEITSTTNVTYSGKLVIATQNNVIMQMTVYGDAANTVAPNIFVKPSTTSDPYIEVYFKPSSWSKNVIHIYGSAIAAEPTNVCTNVSAVPATATSKPTNALNSKANLLGGNTFKGGQEITRDDAGTLLAVVNNVGDSFFEINQNANSSDGSIFIGMDTAQTPISFDGDFGLEGQALLSRGSENTPMWGDIAKHGYIELTNGNLSTIKKVGWYRAAANNSCTDKPSSIGTNQFLLLVEQLSDGTTKQTCYRLDANVYEQLSTAYVRHIAPSGGASGWYPMTLVHNASQTFLGRKTFSDGIELKNSLQVSGSSGTSGQVLTSQGAGNAPIWKDIQVPDKAPLSVPNAKVPMDGKWVSKTWGGYNYFGASLDIWTDGDYIYASNGTSHHKLDKATSTWYITSWKGLTNFLGEYVWTDGNNIYYSKGNEQYVLNKSTSTWSAKAWSGLTNFKGTNIWTDGNNIYYSNGNEQYVLNKSTSTWVVKNWKGYNNLQGEFVWTDGDNIYYSTGSAHYVLDVVTSTWNSKTWNGTNSNLVSGTLIWTDGDNIYCSNGSSTQLQLVKSTVANKTSINSDIKNIYNPITKIIGSNGTYVADSSGSVTLPSDSVASVVDLVSALIGGNAYTVFGDGEEGSFIGMITCEYNESLGGFQFEINDTILTFTPTSQDVTLHITIDRMHSGNVYGYYYTIVASDKSIDTSGFFTDTYSTMYISTNQGSSYYQGGVGVIIKKAV